ncbi:signal transduction histidine kinase [Paenibacillus turicensis]|uniref:Heme sensor protein HssS n=1 Tax=Paenibacillus turicensis TaxID=160487 RepID=A0ABS4FMY6_9BACL|nr:HAMP domain-containing sensor histidine kinase [Paenibacillus turicensis]MBP1903947.1 signal transduction histidine kinase [Paenibacillus turicensis]
MKSIYTRVVVTFIASILLGCVISFFFVTWLYEDELNDSLQETLLDFAQDVAQIYDILPAKDAEKFVSEMKQLNSFYIRIYNEGGQIDQSFGIFKGDEPIPVTQAQLDTVFKGYISKMETNGINAVHIGLPIKVGIERKAMFVERSVASSSAFLVKWVSLFLLYFFIFGSLLIGLAAMFLVRPIKKLTSATKKIAGGDFEVRLDIKQGGEIGTLAESFENMAYDLQQLEQMRKEFVANVSHEVQSPLTSISGYATALKQMNIKDEDRERYLNIIIDEAKRMSKMSDSLLKLSLLESQSHQLQLTSFSLDEQIRRVIVALQPGWSAANIQFDLHLQDVSLSADFDLLNQVWTNIISNSIKFSEQESWITVQLEQKGGNAIVRITDTGIGISSEDQKRIFERFFKADRSHSRKYAGSGMGLAIVKKIVALHQGEVTVESVEGQGTTFIVVLPTSKD